MALHLNILLVVEVVEIKLVTKMIIRFAVKASCKEINHQAILNVPMVPSSSEQ